MKRIPAWRGWRWLVIAWAVSAVLSGRADDAEDNNDGPARFHDVKGWRGTLVARARVNPEALGLIENLMVGHGKGAEMAYDFRAYQVIEFELTEYESDPSVWTGKVTRSQYVGDSRYFLHMPENYANDQTWWKGYSDHEWNYSAAGPLDFGDDPVAKLEFHRKRGWSVHFATGTCKATEHKRWYHYVPPESEQNPEHDLIIGESTTMEEEHEISIAALNGTETHPYPEKGFALVASDPGREGSSPAGGSAGISPSVLWDYTVSLEPIGMEELRLVIDEPAQYPTWRPETTPDAAAGPALDVTVRLETAQGREPKVRVQKFVWELIGTSKEPGVAMNYPLNAKDQRFDLDLGAEGEFFVLRDKNQKMERAVREGFTDKAKVVPYDWGGWSTLQVTAYLTDGRPIIGKLKGQSDAGLRVPKRDAKSYIADGWKKDTGAGGADNTDEETVEGNSFKGDGYTLYEEYRGFVVDGRHAGGDPKKKDLLIRNEIGSDAWPGIHMFEAASGLHAIHRLRKNEFSESERIMNGNHRQAPRQKDQHGIRLITGDAGKVDKESQGGGLTVFTKLLLHGRPEITSRIILPSRGDAGSDFNKPYNLGADDFAVAYDRAVAHEIAHSVGAIHHGLGDIWIVMRYLPVSDPRNLRGRPSLYLDVNGKLEGLDLRREKSDEDFLDQEGPRMEATLQRLMEGYSDLSDDDRKGFTNLLQTYQWYVGVPQGQSSGNEQCLMRYYFAQVYQLKGRPSTFYLVEPGTENVGVIFCKSAAATGANAPNPNHPPRFYEANASLGCGNCRAQICPNDAIKPTARAAGL